MDAQIMYRYSRWIEIQMDDVDYVIFSVILIYSAFFNAIQADVAAGIQFSQTGCQVTKIN